MSHKLDDDEIEEMVDHLHHHHHTSARGFLSGLFLGGVLGAAAAVLMAPYSGRELRHQIKAKAGDVREQALEVAEEARLKAEELQVTGREMFDRNKQRIASTAEAVKQRAKEAWQRNGGDNEPASPYSGPSTAL